MGLVSPRTGMFTLENGLPSCVTWLRTGWQGVQRYSDVWLEKFGRDMTPGTYAYRFRSVWARAYTVPREQEQFTGE